MEDNKLTCFKAYDIRGKLPDQLNETIAYRIGRAYAEEIQPKKVVTGYDIRLSSPTLVQALNQGLLDSGVEVYDIGLCGTEEIYFATFYYQMEGGIMVTASHNPIDYNGMKLVRENAKPISGDSGLKTIQALAEKNQFTQINTSATQHQLNSRSDYIQHLLKYINLETLKPLKIVVDPGHGGAGLVLEALEPYLPFEFIKINFKADGHFPTGIPNPLLPERRMQTIQAVKTHQADLGIAWDGDFDRCFFFDHQGNFIEGYYIVGLLAQAFLNKYPQEKIIHDPRLTWNTIDIAAKYQGKAVQSKTGHAFIKERMRKENAIYGGEMSAHHYFKDFAYCDSGMIPWLLVTELLSQKNTSLAQLIEDRIALFPCSGEINFIVNHPKETMDYILDYYKSYHPEIDYTDGISLSFSNWRFNLRSSNTEPVLRLNIETKNNKDLLTTQIQKLTQLIQNQS